MSDRFGELAALDALPDVGEPLIGDGGQLSPGLPAVNRFADFMTSGVERHNDPTVLYRTASPLVNITEGDIGGATAAAMGVSGGGMSTKGIPGKMGDLAATNRLVAAPEGGVYEPSKIRPNEKYFKSLDPEGNTRLEALVRFGDKGTASVQDILVPGMPRETARGTIGTTDMRDLLRQFREMHPDVTQLSGKRVSGAKEGGGYSLTNEPRDVSIGIGHNNPPPEMQMGEIAASAPPLSQARSWAQDLPRPRPAANATEIPDIRGMSVRDAIAEARLQQHLIEAGGTSESKYVGGPRTVQTKQGLNKLRKDFDEYIGADPRGGDWYDRYRSGVSDVTGNDPVHNKWMANQEGQWSAGVDPGSELHFALKENNAAIAGMPVKAARPAQHEAHLRAIASKDPGKYQLGDKTGEYANLVNPDVVNTQPPGATGVNDFRHARNWGYTEASGAAQRDALTSAQHGFLDYETALAVDRANKNNLGGRSDWTGEQLQAAPWVRQKALDIQSRGGKNADGSLKMSYDEAFERANKTIADYFPRHTAYATFEAQPGSVSGHLPGSVGAGAAERVAYAGDPASTWATAPGGRDAIYSGLGIEGTGNYMRVRPSEQMTGYYKNPEGVVETNPGEVARPLVTFNTAKVPDKNFIGPPEFEPFKILTPHDRSLLEAGEAFRGYVDAQNASAFHKNWTGGPQNQMNSLYFPRTGKASPAELEALQNKATPYGLNDVVDTGSGITTSSFYPGTSEEIGKAVGKATKKGEFGEFGEPTRVRTEGGYIDYTDKWPAGVGSGQATQHMLQYVNKTPEIRTAFNNNPYIAERALAKLERDEAWASKWGVPREDIQNARRILSEGPGGIDRLEAALKKGAIALPVLGAILAGGTALLKQGGDHEGL